MTKLSFRCDNCGCTEDGVDYVGHGPELPTGWFAVSFAFPNASCGLVHLCSEACLEDHGRALKDARCVREGRPVYDQLTGESK